MSQDGKNLSVTLKAGTDYAAPWIVVYGDTPGEVENKLNNMAGLIEATVGVANQLKAVNAASHLPATPVAEFPPAPQQQPSWGQQQPVHLSPQPPQQNAVVYHPEGIKCPVDGALVQKKVITAKATGKKHELWTCPNQRARDDGHFSAFAN